MRALVLELCRRNGGNFLETGCGEGLFLARLVQINKDVQVYGADISKDMLEKAGCRLKDQGSRIHLVESDISRLPFNDDFFDTVVCLNVLLNFESFEKVSGVFKEISRVLKPGGRFICDLRNRWNPFIYLKYKLAHYYDNTLGNMPLKAYYLSEVVKDLKRLGFKIDKTTSLGFLAPVIIIEAQK